MSSADSLAYFIHFHLVDRPAGEELEWFDKAMRLWNELQRRDQTKDPCNGAVVGLDEFMMRADAGKQLPAFLDTAISNSSSPLYRGVAEYLQGALDDAAMEAKLSINRVTPNYLCNARPYMLWNDVRLGRHEAAEKIYSQMQNIGPEDCGSDLIYAQQLGFGPGHYRRNETEARQQILA
jgi:hypothetical protein